MTKVSCEIGKKEWGKISCRLLLSLGCALKGPVDEGVGGKEKGEFHTIVKADMFLHLFRRHLDMQGATQRQ